MCRECPTCEGGELFLEEDVEDNRFLTWQCYICDTSYGLSEVDSSVEDQDLLMISHCSMKKSKKKFRNTILREKIRKCDTLDQIKVCMEEMI